MKINAASVTKNGHKVKTKNKGQKIKYFGVSGMLSAKHVLAAYSDHLSLRRKPTPMNVFRRPHVYLACACLPHK